MAIIGGRGLKFNVEVDPKSTKEVVQNIQKYEKSKRNQLGTAIDKYSNLMVRDMKANILVDTGLARASTGRALSRKDGYIEGASVYTRVHYAVFIERMKAYFVPAYNKYSMQFLAEVKRIMRKVN